MKFPGRSDRIVSAFAQRLPKGRATSIVGGVAALGKGLPFPADCALPTMLVARLSVTELSTWPTSGMTKSPDSQHAVIGFYAINSRLS